VTDCVPPFIISCSAVERRFTDPKAFTLVQLQTKDQSMPRILRHIVPSALLALCLTTHANPAEASQLTKVTVICNSWVGFAPVFVAEELGYDRKLGIDVTVRFDDSKSDALVALERGDVDIDLMTVDDVQRLPWAHGRAGVIIGTIDQSLGGDGIVADGDIHNVTQLRGKLVATDSNIPATLLLELELAKHHMSLKDLNIRQISGSDAVATFADRSVAAVGTYQPDIGQIMKIDKARKPHLLVSSQQFPGYIVDVAVVTKARATTEKKNLQAFLSGVYKAVALFSSNRTLFAKTASPHYGLSAQEFLASINGSLVYTNLKQSIDYMGEQGKPGKLAPIFAKIMQLNLQTGSAPVELKASDLLDNSIISGVTQASVR
jgi:NitT/TauT family transport system substrate-binding protein